MSHASPSRGDTGIPRLAVEAQLMIASHIPAAGQYLHFPARPWRGRRARPYRYLETAAFDELPLDVQLRAGGASRPGRHAEVRYEGASAFTNWSPRHGPRIIQSHLTNTGPSAAGWWRFRGLLRTPEDARPELLGKIDPSAWKNTRLRRLQGLLFLQPRVRLLPAKSGGAGFCELTAPPARPSVTW
jgi:hypothetical protein